MIRTLGFLTGIAVTGTAVWLLSDGDAVTAAMDSMATYLEETASTRPIAPPAGEAQASILPPATIMSRPGAPRAMPAGATPAAVAETVEAADAPTDMPAASPEPSVAFAKDDESAAKPQTRAQVSPAMTDAPGDAAVASPDAVVMEYTENASGEAAVDALMTADPRSLSEDPRPSMEDQTDPRADVEQVDEQALIADGNWFAFWTPFRSRASADGFARHLVQATGQEIRVLRVGPGEYRVAFFHDGEEDRQRHLASLESASGLELGGEL